MLIDGRFSVCAPPQSLLVSLFDAGFMAGCLPGCESLQALDDNRYRAVVLVGLAGIRARFDLLVEITRREPLGIWTITRGEEGGNASTLTADSQISLEPILEGTLVSYRSEVAVAGRLGRFALGMMRKKAQSMGEEFAQTLRERLEHAGSSAPAEAASRVASATEPGAPDHGLAAAPVPAVGAATAQGPGAAGGAVGAPALNPQR